MYHIETTSGYVSYYISLELYSLFENISKTYELTPDETLYLACFQVHPEIFKHMNFKGTMKLPLILDQETHHQINVLLEEEKVTKQDYLHQLLNTIQNPTKITTDTCLTPFPLDHASVSGIVEILNKFYQWQRIQDLRDKLNTFLSDLIISLYLTTQPTEFMNPAFNNASSIFNIIMLELNFDQALLLLDQFNKLNQRMDMSEKVNIFLSKQLKAAYRNVSQLGIQTDWNVLSPLSNEIWSEVCHSPV